MTEALPPHLFVIFGASGDLTRRKLMPALLHLTRHHDELQCVKVLGASRSDWSDQQFRSEMRESLADIGGVGEEELDAWCDKNLYYQCLGPKGVDFEALKERIDDLENKLGLEGNRIFYLSLPPSAFAPTIEGLGETGLNRSAGWTRFVIEKPFGRDLESAHALNETIHKHFDESQVYRIDHYLGKETVQNLLVFRFANALFENVWNRDRIEKIEIVVDESLGVGDRAGYYDKSGALRDMIQNHLTQLLSIIAMETPSHFDAKAIRREKIKLLESIRPIKLKNVTYGQYAAGTVKGEDVIGYHEENNIPSDSRTPTFVEIRLEVANWRWEGVPFILRTGKRMPARKTTITVRFRQAPVSIFNASAEGDCGLSPNVLVMTLQPNEGFDLYFEVKQPQTSMIMKTQKLSYRYGDVFGPLPDAYETLLNDVMEGDQTLFVHADEVEASWRLYTPLLEADIEPVPYEAGTYGPTSVESAES